MNHNNSAAIGTYLTQIKQKKYILLMSMKTTNNIHMLVCYLSIRKHCVGEIIINMIMFRRLVFIAPQGHFS